VQERVFLHGGVSGTLALLPLGCGHSDSVRRLGLPWNQALNLQTAAAGRNSNEL